MLKNGCFVFLLEDATAAEEEDQMGIDRTAAGIVRRANVLPRDKVLVVIITSFRRFLNSKTSRCSDHVVVSMVGVSALQI